MKHKKQIDIFIEGVKRYFDHLTFEEELLEIGAPYLVRNSERLGLDYTGAISITGDSKGYVFFSSTSPLLKYILLGHGASNFSEEYLGDIVGEIANTISGNARSHMGAEFHISPPKVIVGEINKYNMNLNSRSYVLPIRWRRNSAQLIVSLEENEQLL